MAQQDRQQQELDEVDEARADAAEAVLAATLVMLILNTDPTSPAPSSILGRPDWPSMIRLNLEGALRDYLTSVSTNTLNSMGINRYQAAEQVPRLVAEAMPEAVEALASGAAHLSDVAMGIARGEQGYTRASVPSSTPADRSGDAYRRIRVGSALLARNQVTAMREALRHRLALAAGATHATWRTRKDTRVRPTHGGLEGDTNPIGVPWTTFEGHPLRFPGDPLAPPDETANCRCRLAYRLPETTPTIADMFGPEQVPPSPSHLQTEYEGAAA